MRRLNLGIFLVLVLVLRITAGPGYDLQEHVQVPVNTPTPLSIKSPQADIDLNVRVQNYDGLPLKSPPSSPYFDTEPHAYNQDQYSICFRFTPKSDIKASDLQFGNDFDRPIRDRLPPGFNTAMGIVRWWIDPGLDGDAYADRPYLYGPALSSLNALSVGPGVFDEAKGGIFVEEGGDEAQRGEEGMPSDAKARMKWALNDAVKERFLFRKDQTYAMDFFNPYLDFSNFALRLPGFHLPILKYWDGQGIRYVPWTTFLFLVNPLVLLMGIQALRPGAHIPLGMFYGTRRQGRSIWPCVSRYISRRTSMRMAM